MIPNVDCPLPEEPVAALGRTWPFNGMGFDANTWCVRANFCRELAELEMSLRLNYSSDAYCPPKQNQQERRHLYSDGLRVTLHLIPNINPVSESQLDFLG